MIEINTPKCISGESLEEWLSDYVKKELKVDCVFLLADKPWDCTSESSIFTTVDLESPLSKEDLILKIADCSNEKFAYFYIQDVMSGAYGSGLLDKGFYHFYYSGSH